MMQTSLVLINLMHIQPIGIPFREPFTDLQLLRSQTITDVRAHLTVLEQKGGKG